MSDRLKTIRVVMDGGLIEDILDIPPGFRVKVFDYDIEGADPEDLEVDRNGDEYYTTIFESDADLDIGDLPE